MGVREKDREAFRQALDDAKAIVAHAKDQDRDLTDSEFNEVEALAAKADELQGRMSKDGRDDTLVARLQTLMGGTSDAAPSGFDPKSLGEAVVESPAFKAWVEQHSVDGRLPESLHVQTDPIPVGAKFISTVDMATAFPNEDRRGVLVPEPWPVGYEGFISLLSRGSTTAAIIYYAIEDWTNNADFVAEATATTGASGQKPESDVTYTPASVPVGTVAHWVAATKNSLADYGQLRALIDAGLRRGLLMKIASAALAGDGVAPEWFGFNTLATIPAIAFAGTMLSQLKGALVALESAGFPASAIVMNPADWSTLDQTVPNVVTDPLANRGKQVGGVPVVTVPAQPAGYAIVGDFKQAYLLDREAATVTATDSHSDFFTRNLVAILGEWRGAFFVPNPNAFRKVDIVTP